MLKDTPRDANPEMDCSPDDLLGWKDFPKGLRVLVLDEDNTSLAEVKSKLESMDYVVSAYHNNNEALMALSSENNGFHIALVEVSADNNHEAFKFLEKVKDVPIVMTSSINCLTVMMKCIALGAVEFLQKPLSEDKLRNIWQHVVHKAIRKSGSIHIKPMEDDSITWNADLESEDADGDKQNVSETDSTGQGYEQNFEQCGNDRLPEPATPTFKHGKSDQSFCTSENASPKQDGPIEIGKSKADYTYSDCSSVKENNEKVEKQVKRGEFNSRETESNSQRVDYHVQEELKTQEIEIKPENLCSSTTKSVENTCKYLDDENGCMEDVPSEFVDALTDREKDKCIISSNVPIVDNFVSNQPNGKRKRESIPPSPCNNRLSKKKLKIDWTPELHRRFVQAVEQLGVEQAIPSKILELMKVDGLTRHNVASHLQKYRMNRRLVLPKPEKHRWQYQRHTIHRGYTHKPIMAYPPFYPYCGISSNQVYSSWIQPGYHQSNAMQVWANQNFSQWACPTVHHNAWGSPAVSIQDPCVFSQTEEVIDRVIKEAINKPWLPLPLGLKPPSMESVLTELNRQGIRNISFRRS